MYASKVSNDRSTSAFTGKGSEKPNSMVPRRQNVSHLRGAIQIAKFSYQGLSVRRKSINNTLFAVLFECESTNIWE